jgi:hypothetical protein
MAIFHRLFSRQNLIADMVRTKLEREALVLNVYIYSAKQSSVKVCNLTNAFALQQRNDRTRTPRISNYKIWKNVN